MWRDECRPLPLDLWLQELGQLSARCSRGPREGEDRAVRQAFHLSRLAPLAVRKILISAVSELELETMLESGETERAALMVVGGGATVETRHDEEGGRHVATFAPLGDDPIRFEATSPVLAMIGAWAQFLRTVRED